MSHRGGFQAQGGHVEESEPWDEPKPLAALSGRHLLHRLQQKLTFREAAIRDEAFRKAHRFIDGCASRGGVGPTKQSWPKPSRRDSRRVDIEVQSGIAFI